MEINKNIEKQWGRLFKYYEQSLTKKCKGATEEELRQAEKELGVNFPKAFSDSFKICDERYLFGQNGKIGWFGQYDHFSLNHGYGNFYNLIEVNNQLRTYDPTHKEKTKWVTFYTYETWFYVILDTENEHIYLREAEDSSYIKWANSYEEWLEMAVDEVLEYGELRLESIEKFFGIE